MSKEAYYFSHDSNARNDEKILALRMKHGWEGYGLYWALIERLRDNEEFTCVKDYNLIAFDLRSDASKIKSLVEDFRLFVFTDDGKYFYSESLNKRMEKKESISEARSKAAKKRWAKESNNQTSNANAMQNSANAKQKDAKESKGKENKVKENKEIKKSSRFSAPTKEDVFSYMLQEKNAERKIALKESESFWNYYDSKGWMVGRTKMKNWKSAVSGWLNRMENFKKTEPKEKQTASKAWREKVGM